MPIYQNLSIQSIRLTQFTKNSPIFLIPIFASAACSFDFSKLSFSKSFQSFLHGNNFKEINVRYSQFSHFLNSAIKTENRDSMECKRTWPETNNIYLFNCVFTNGENSAIHSENSTLRMYKCSFTNCQSGKGGAVYHTGQKLSSNGCIYTDCFATTYAGCIYHEGPGDCNLYRSSFIRPNAPQYTTLYITNVPSADPYYKCFVIEFCYFQPRDNQCNSSLWYVEVEGVSPPVFDLRGCKFSILQNEFEDCYAFNYSYKTDPHVVFGQLTDNMFKEASEQFTASLTFSETNSFSVSEYFSMSFNFTISNVFASTPYFSNSFNFTPSLSFSSTDSFTSTTAFTQTSNFTETQNFTVSSRFTQSFPFLPSGTFSSSPMFTSSISFTKSIEFSPSQSPTPKFTPIPTLSPTSTGQLQPFLSGSYTNSFSKSSSFTQSSFFAGGGDSTNGNARSSSIQAKGIMILFIILLCIILLIGLIANIILCIQQIQSGEIITTQRI